MAVGTRVGLAPAALLLQGAPAGAVTQPFITPGAESFTIPSGICSVAITADGGQGGASSGGGTGGTAASVSGRVTVAPGLVLDIFVAGVGGTGGATGGAGGVGGGGGGGGSTGQNVAGGGGGGASVVSLGGSPLVVAAGGGGEVSRLLQSDEVVGARGKLFGTR